MNELHYELEMQYRGALIPEYLPGALWKQVAYQRE